MTASNSSADKDKSKSSHTASGMAKKIIKDSDKSSGTNNLVGTGGGNSTLTGKNPFAILKASAIAAT
jgi:Dullard-like phosphatase family protein